MAETPASDRGHGAGRSGTWSWPPQFDNPPGPRAEPGAIQQKKRLNGGPVSARAGHGRARSGQPASPLTPEQ